MRARSNELATDIGRESDSPRRVELTARLFETQTMIKDASAAFHQFRPAALASTLSTLRQRLADIADAHGAGGRP